MIVVFVGPKQTTLPQVTLEEGLNHGRTVWTIGDYASPCLWSEPKVRAASDDKAIAARRAVAEVDFPDRMWSMRTLTALRAWRKAATPNFSASVSSWSYVFFGFRAVAALAAADENSFLDAVAVDMTRLPMTWILWPTQRQPIPVL